MKLKKLSPLEYALIAAVIILLVLNVFLQMEALRFVMWGLVIVLVVMNFMFNTCPNCGKRIRSSFFICPHCGHEMGE